jgi:hypothetical protein
MCELKKDGMESKFVKTGPSSYKKKRIYRAAVSQRLRNTALHEDLGYAVVRLVKSLRYKPEGRGFDSL